MNNKINPDTERRLFSNAVTEHLGPTSLIGGSMSVLDAFELGWQARASIEPAIRTGWQLVLIEPPEEANKPARK